MTDGQNTAAAERSAHEAPAKSEDTWPVVEVSPGLWKLRRIVELEAERDALRHTLGTLAETTAPIGIRTLR